MKSKKNYWLWAALIVVALLIAKYANSSWHKYQLWEDHKAYFEQAKENRQVKSWMSLSFIKSHFSTDPSKFLDFEPSFWEERKPLGDLCKSHNLSCSKLVEQLNHNLKT